MRVCGGRWTWLSAIYWGRPKGFHRARFSYGHGSIQQPWLYPRRSTHHSFNAQPGTKPSRRYHHTTASRAAEGMFRSVTLFPPSFL